MDDTHSTDKIIAKRKKKKYDKFYRIINAQNTTDFFRVFFSPPDKWQRNKWNVYTIFGLKCILISTKRKFNFCWILDGKIEYEFVFKNYQPFVR